MNSRHITVDLLAQIGLQMLGGLDRFYQLPRGSIVVHQNLLLLRAQ